MNDLPMWIGLVIKNKHFKYNKNKIKNRNYLVKITQMIIRKFYNIEPKIILKKINQITIIRIMSKNKMI